MSKSKRGITTATENLLGDGTRDQVKVNLSLTQESVWRMPNTLGSEFQSVRKSALIKIQSFRILQPHLCSSLLHREPHNAPPAQLSYH